MNPLLAVCVVITASIYPDAPIVSALASVGVVFMAYYIGRRDQRDREHPDRYTYEKFSDLFL